MQEENQSHEDDVLTQGVERTLEFFQGVSKFFETLVNDKPKNEQSAEESPTKRNQAWTLFELSMAPPDESSNQVFSQDNKVRAQITQIVCENQCHV
jgi:hypothetical protein